MIKRIITLQYLVSLEDFPVTGIVGPRQVGKTTLVKQYLSAQNMRYLDLERSSDLAKLRDPELFLSQYIDQTIILDEIQHLPELFPLLRSLVDEHRHPGRFVILGSASPTLLRQSSESLAGRINYLEMHPFSLLEVKNELSWQGLWLYGGFPEPTLSTKPTFAQAWYRNFVQSYVQRDLPQYGLPAKPTVTQQLLRMIASAHGNVLNYSTYAKSLGLTVPTIKTYLSFLSNAFLISLVSPWHINIKKRLVKSPKIYLRDSGMHHYLLGISSLDGLLGHVLLGNSWEGFVIHQIASLLRSDDELYYYRTQDGAEIDLLVRRNDQWLVAAEIKFTSTPSLRKGTYIAMQDLGISKLYVIVPDAERYPLNEKVEVIGLQQCLQEIIQLN